MMIIIMRMMILTMRMLMMMMMRMLMRMLMLLMMLLLIMMMIMMMVMLLLIGGSLQQTGKSRADLWQLAALVALERTMERANRACDLDYTARQQVRTRPVGSSLGQAQGQVRVKDDPWMASD